MDILFCAFFEGNNSSGVDKKIIAQIKAFEKMGNNVYYFTIKSSAVYLCGKEEEQRLFGVSGSMVDVYLKLERAARHVINSRQIDLMYIRRIFCSPFHLKTLRLAKKRNIVLVEEFPTYPYDGEKFASLSYKIAAVVDRVSRNFYRYVLNYIATYSNDDEIFGVETIKLSNAIGYEDMAFEEMQNSKDVNMICVSAMATWHGYERIILGLGKYYEKAVGRKVYLHMVGDGIEATRWKALCEDENLQQYVVFYGKKSGNELDAIFEKCNIGIGTLGAYKKELFNASELKLREYATRGKLIVYSVDDDAFEHRRFALKFPNDESVIDVDKIVSFYESFDNLSETSREINAFAKNSFAWEAQLQKVIAKCEGEQK